MSDAEVGAFWTFMTREFVPACSRVSGLRAVRMYSGHGALRADLRLALEMDNAAVYEDLVDDPSLRPLVARFYAAVDLQTSTQAWLREITPGVLRTLAC